SAVPALAQTYPGEEVTVNPAALGHGYLLYPGGKYGRNVGNLLQPGEHPGDTGVIHLHMPPKHPRVARAPRPTPMTPPAAATPQAPHRRTTTWPRRHPPRPPPPPAPPTPPNPNPPPTPPAAPPPPPAAPPPPSPPPQSSDPNALPEDSATRLLGGATPAPMTP